MSKKLLQNKRILLLLLALSLGVFVFGLYGLWQYRQTTSEAPDHVANSSTGVPIEDAIDPTSKYDVPADHPRRIVLPTIGAEGFVQQVSVDKDGMVGAPTNINLAGWFKNKAKPGDEGLSLIDGHASGKYHPGIFKNLKNLKAGDKFEVEFGDYTKRQFEVVSVRSYNIADVVEYMFDQDSAIDKQLNLITCGGRFDAKTQQYEERVLAVAKRID